MNGQLEKNRAVQKLNDEKFDPAVEAQIDKILADPRNKKKLQKLKRRIDYIRFIEKFRNPSKDEVLAKRRRRKKP